MDDNCPTTSRELLNLKDLGIDEKFILYSCITMESAKYICIRETNSIVIIEMTKPMQPIRLPITADSAIMNPDTPILAFTVQAEIDGTIQDQLHIFNIEEKTTLKSCNIAEKVKYWKWMTPKLLGLVTLKAVYHWSMEGSTGPVKMSDITDKVKTCNIVSIRNYMHDLSEKWLALIGTCWDELFNVEAFLWIRPYQNQNENGMEMEMEMEQWLSFPAHAAAFTTINVEENDAPITLLCYAHGIMKSDGKRALELSVSDALVAKHGEPGFGNKQSEFSIDNRPEYPLAMQIEEKYGLIYVMMQQGIFIHDLETAEVICNSCVSDHLIIRTKEGANSGSFYSINTEGQVLLTTVKDSTILSFVSEKFLTRGKLRDLTKLCLQMIKGKEELVTELEKSLQAETRKKEEIEEQLSEMRKELHRFQALNQEMSNENEGLVKQNAELQNESAKIKKHLKKSLQLEMKMRRETEKQLTSLKTDLNTYQKTQQNLRIEIEGLTMQNAQLQNEKDDFAISLQKSLQEAETKVRRETEEQLTSIKTKLNDSLNEILNGIIELKKQNTKMQDERDKVVTQLEESLLQEKKARREIEEQLSNKMLELNDYKESQKEMMNELEGLKMQNTEL